MEKGCGSQGRLCHWHLCSLWCWFGGVTEAAGIRALGKGGCAVGKGRVRAVRCARRNQLKEPCAAARTQTAARRSHFTSLAWLLPAHFQGYFFQKGGLQCCHPLGQGEGQAEEGDINWSSLKICRAWNDLDYRRVESSNFPSITT